MLLLVRASPNRFDDGGSRSASIAARREYFHYRRWSARICIPVRSPALAGGRVAGRWLLRGDERRCYVDEVTFDGPDGAAAETDG